MRYWDPDIHPDEHQDCEGPASVQFYFYPRHGEGMRCNELSENANDICNDSSNCIGEGASCDSNIVLSPREKIVWEEPDPRDAEQEIFEYQTLLLNKLKSYYITRINWGDGNQENSALIHDYRKPGVYEVTGVMFSMNSEIEQNEISADFTQDADNGVRDFARFRVVFSLSSPVDLINDFPQLGGIDYTYIPQGDLVNDENPIVGGISANSLYAKTIKRKIGYSSIITTPEEPYIFDVKWPFYQDKLDAEYALAQVDQRLLGKDISRFTGSNAANSSLSINSDTPFIDWDGQIVEASRAHGFFSGSVDSVTGEILDTPTPQVIHRGNYKNYGNLGDHIGDADIGQVRYMTEPYSMWEMLVFEDTGIDPYKYYF